MPFDPQAVLSQREVDRVSAEKTSAARIGPLFETPPPRSRVAPVAAPAGRRPSRPINGGGWVTVQSNVNTSWNAGGKGNGSYGYRVQACNAAGCGPWSGTSSVTVALVPPVPVGAYVEEFWTPKTSGYRAHWSAVAGASRYEAIRNDTGASVYNGTNTTFLIGSAFMPELPVYYSFSVRACNAVGCSAWAVGY